MGPRFLARSIVLAMVLGALLVLPSAAFGLTAIKGTVEAPVAVDEVEVCVVEPVASETCTYPQAGGAYTLAGIEPGIYQVVFIPSYRSHLVKQYYNHKPKLSEANKIQVTQNAETKNVDASLELGGEIEGRATDTLTALGLEEVEVCAQDATTGAAVSCAHTDSHGDYALPSVPAGTYRVGFWGERQSADYAPQYYDGMPSFVNGTVIPVAAGETVTGIDAEMKVGAQLGGTVTDAATGSPLDGVVVCILMSTASAPQQCVYSEASGGYRFRGLASGSYQVAFSPEFNEFSNGEFVLPDEDGWQTQYYAGALSRAASTTLTLTAPQQLGGIDAAMWTTIAPPAPSPPPPPPTTAIPAPPVVNQPPPRRKKPRRCRHGKRKRKVKGKVRCVKLHKRHRRHHRSSGKAGSGRGG